MRRNEFKNYSKEELREISREARAKHNVVKLSVNNPLSDDGGATIIEEEYYSTFSLEIYDDSDVIGTRYETDSGMNDFHVKLDSIVNAEVITYEELAMEVSPS